MEISEAITNFEMFNGIKTSAYCTEKTYDGSMFSDESISDEVFQDHIEAWLYPATDREMVNELLLLLSNYTYLPENIFSLHIRNIVNDILDDSSVSIDRILFLLFPSKKNCESGSSYVNAAISKHYRGRVSIRNVITFSPLNELKDKTENNTLDKTFTEEEKKKYNEEYTKRLDESTTLRGIDLNDYDAIVFFDDIIGSGSTLNRYMRSFYRVNPSAVNKKTYIACVCTNKNKFDEKVAEISKEVVSIDKAIYSINQEKCYRERHISNNRKMIESLEKNIESHSDDEETQCCAMGYKNGEFLISFYYNTPNNTLSLFWRKTSVSPCPLFIRNRQTRPSIDELKKYKALYRANAYNMRKKKSE